MIPVHIVEIPRPDQHTVWLSKKLGIRSRREFARHANRSFSQNCGDILSCWVNGLVYSCSAGYKRFDAKKRAVSFPQFDDKAPIGSQGTSQKIGLVVFFHGLNGQPSLWDGHVDKLKQHPEVDLFVPETPEEGHKSLTDPTTDALLARVVDWTKKNPGKPVAFFGQSNGSRAALHCEVELRKHAPKTPVHVSLTAGVIYGSSTVDLANTVLHTNENEKRSFGMLSLVNCEELPHASDTARKLVRSARKALARGVAKRDYTMYSPMHDVLVPETGSGLPILVPDGQKSKTEKHYLVTNYGHNAMVTALAARQIDYCVNWMKKNSA